MENGESFCQNPTTVENRPNLTSENNLKIAVIESMSKNTGYEAQIIATKGIFNKRVGSALLNSFDIDASGNINSAHLNVVETVKKYRGKGIGRTVVETAIAHARKRGIKMIELDSVDNAVEFYKKLGFKEVENGNGRMQIDLTSGLNNQEL